MKLNLRSVDLNLLPVFVAVMEEGQLSRAAERLGMSQPAVSSALKRLRLTVGADLFSRSRAGLSPTPEARRLYESVAEGLGILTGALDSRQPFDPAASERQFRVMAPDYFDALALGPLITTMRQFGEGMSIRVLSLESDWVRTLVNTEADIAFDSVSVEDPRLKTEVIGVEKPVVVARSGHPRIDGKLTPLDYMKAEHVVLPERERRVLPLEKYLGHPVWERWVGAQVTQLTNLLFVASDSDLIATVPLRLAQRFAPLLGLQVLPFPMDVGELPIYAIWPKVLDQDPAHQWFRQQIRDKLSQ
ncbi:LysR family transcriptional regulator [Halospina denitrificans]|uniref:LysR family transcriptional regulator n=1 Tax=Halospina denitrificans TaxID=332522 RepID=A0A4R7K0U2_9GAMM|nr:LysR family transcriptional regulator [Halospina denitrificans]TDT44462.1 LysR family transcriptional regulator [Halospina denitrificans]